MLITGSAQGLGAAPVRAFRADPRDPESLPDVYDRIRAWRPVDVLVDNAARPWAGSLWGPGAVRCGMPHESKASAKTTRKDELTCRGRLFTLGAYKI